jgi:hypothetical protein
MPMNSIEIIILYLTCGAPFAVYFYLQNSVARKPKHLLLETAAVFILWIPFAIYTFNQSKSLKKLFRYDSSKNDFDVLQTEKKLFSLQKEIEKILITSTLKLSLFDFRQTLDRYAGLSLSTQDAADDLCEQEKEVFRISEEKNINLAAICLKRRNRKLLEFHHKKARRDFLQVITNLSESISDRIDLEILSLEFVDLLNDFEAHKSLKKLFTAELQTENSESVTQLENVLWKPEPPKPLLTKTTISARLPVMSATANSLHSKD